MPATWSLASFGCDHENGVTRQTRRPILRRVYARRYSRPMSDVVSAVTIDLRENGPLKVTGPITIRDFEGREFVLPEGSAVALCRCGHSGNKPFCDGTHKRVGFVADDPALRRPL